MVYSYITLNSPPTCLVSIVSIAALNLLEIESLHKVVVNFIRVNFII